MDLKLEPFSPLASPDSGYGDSHPLGFQLGGQLDQQLGEDLDQQLGLLEQQLQLSQEERLEGELLLEQQPDTTRYS